MKYGKITENGLIVNPNHIEYQGRTIINPSPSTLTDAGFLPLAENQPENPSTQIVVNVTFEERNGMIFAVYEYKDKPPRNLELSKRKLMNNLKTAKIWDTIKESLVQSGKWDDFLMATTLEEQDPMMQNAIAGVASLGVSQEDIEKILVNSQYD